MMSVGNSRGSVSRIVPRSLRAYFGRTFCQISESKPGTKVSFCVQDSDASSLSAVEFDTFKKDRYASMWQKCGHLPCSVDALYFPKGKNQIFAVEFKTGDANGTNLVRKIYDTIMCLSEYGGIRFSYERARKELCYVVVAPERDIKAEEKSRQKRQSANLACALSRAMVYQDNPEFGEGARAFFGLNKLEGVIVSRVFTLSPGKFAAFARDQRWV